MNTVMYIGASKSAVNSLSKAMRIDLLKHNIKVTNIARDWQKRSFPWSGSKVIRRGQSRYIKESIH
jgi:short-subunit dehydrogenase